MSSASPATKNTVLQHHYDLVLSVFEENLKIEGCLQDEIQKQRMAIKVIFNEVISTLNESHFKTPLRNSTAFCRSVSKAMDGKNFPNFSEFDKRLFSMRLISCMEHFWNSFAIERVNRKLSFSDEKKTVEGKEEKKTDSSKSDKWVQEAFASYQKVIASMPKFFANNYGSMTSDSKKFESALVQLLTHSLVKDVIMTQLSEVKDRSLLARNSKDFNITLFQCLRDVIFPTILNDREFIKLVGEENTIIIPVAFSDDHFSNILMGVKISNVNRNNQPRSGFTEEGLEIGGSFENDDEEWNVSDFDDD